eukprot:gnl/TRDRNA2_/TRDRNA2_196007_c0_seq1.p1 gnl/TRDRNA2_/TRDRNA2_196007_c0~~gnl/TRDRNA2_/TRDRNA2_196007_c0_seq1.p1  ORF type:complete len:137 (-),score=11.76 gnl/TRDRNA2_/TRDRNA2_196007_c0_seq1:144-554(-)
MLYSWKAVVISALFAVFYRGSADGHYGPAPPGHFTHKHNGRTIQRSPELGKVDPVSLQSILDPHGNIETEATPRPRIYKKFKAESHRNARVEVGLMFFGGLGAAVALQVGVQVWLEWTWPKEQWKTPAYFEARKRI